MELEKHFEAFRALIDGGETTLRRSAPELSAWDIGQHLDHMLKVCSGVFTLIEKSKPLDEPGINPRGRFVLTFGRIPRGRARSPEPVAGTIQPPEKLAELLRHVSETLPRICSAAPSTSKVFRHPYFRALTARQALRFCEVHNNHHLRIIRRIKQG